MLVLHRKELQSIYVDGPCMITVSDISGGSVKLGFEADKTTTILREELMGINPRDNDDQSTA